MLRSYNPILVAASLLVATLASYAALDLSARVARAVGGARALWLAGGALAMGAGIWGMHFVGMLAFGLADGRGRAVPIAYHVPGVGASVVIAVVASALALAVAAREAVGRAAFAAGGLVMGVAIAGMHYVGVAAMRLPGHPMAGPAESAADATVPLTPITYRPVLVATAYGIAVAASLVALALARRGRRLAAAAPGIASGGAPVRPTTGPRALALPALLMGGAIAGMHYVGMASARFHPVLPAGDAPIAPAQAEAVVATPAVGAAVTVVVFVVLALALVATTVGGGWAADADAAVAAVLDGGAVRGAPAGRPRPTPSTAARLAQLGRDASGAPTLRLKLVAASGAGGLVLVVGALAYLGLWQYRRASDWVEHTNAVRTSLARVPSALHEAEAAARGFVLAGTPPFVAEYARASAAARQAVADARRLTVDNPDQQRRLATLPPLLDRRLGVLDDYVGRRRTGGVAAVTALAGAAGGTAGVRGPALSDSIQAVVAAADGAEVRLLGGRSAVLVRRGRLVDAVLLGGSLLAFLLILLVTQAIRRDVALRETAQRRVEAQADELAAQAEQLEGQQARLEEQLEEEQVLTEELTEANARLGAAQDAQARALTVARREEARYRALVEAGAQIVWSTAPDGGFFAEQPAWGAFTGQTPAQYRDWGWLDAVHPDDRDATTAAWEMAIASGTAGRFETEHRLRRRDGAYRRMSVRAVPVRADGALTGAAVREWVGVHVDVTGERRVQAQREALIRALERSNRDLDQFAYVASHDLKAPLRGISNLSSWIEEDLGAVMTADTREQMGLLRGRVHRMEALIDGVLQYSRAGRVKAAPEPVDTGALAREAVELLAPKPGARVCVAPDLPTVLAERVPLQQVLLNLVGNALKYAGRDDAVVDVTAVPAAGPGGAPADLPPGEEAADRGGAPGWYTFTVADNGPGIAPQYHERVFGIFQTLQSRDRVEGTGIGLSVVKKIVEGQGGRVWVESAEGEGARLRFTWPAAPPAAAETA